MKTRVTLLAGCFALVALANLHAVEIAGKVQSASGDTATISAEGDAVPSVGDKLSIFFKMDGLDEEVGVATGTVTAVEADGIKAQIDEATGTVAKDQLVRIVSANPSKRSAPKPSPPPESPSQETFTIPSGTPTPKPSVAETTTKVVTFDDLPLGPLAADALSNYGIRIEKGKGVPEIFAAQPNMLLPSRRRKVMLVGGGPVTSISIVFDQPVKRFSIDRVGTAKGASTPTWTMTAFNGSRSIDTAGETHGLPPKPKSFAIEGEGITRVRIDSDNRFGAGTWATWNSLPIAGFAFER